RPTKTQPAARSSVFHSARNPLRTVSSWGRMAPMGSILYLTEVPPDGGGDTMFANMYVAYEMLSEPIRKLIDELTAVHDGEKHYRGRYGNDDRGKVYPRAEHPIVRTHPETGKKCLFVNRFFTTHIVGLRKNESDAAGFVSIEVTDATDDCLGGFRANLARWPGAERR